MATIDWTDPCAKAAALSAAYYRLISGETEQLIRYRGPEGEREVRFAKIDIETLRSEMRQAQADCDARNGTPTRGRRFAIRGGARR